MCKAPILHKEEMVILTMATKIAFIDIKEDPKWENFLQPAPSITEWDYISKATSPTIGTRGPFDPAKALLEDYNIVADYRGGVFWIDEGWKVIRTNPCRGGVNQYTTWPAKGDQEEAWFIANGKDYTVKIRYI